MENIILIWPTKEHENSIKEYIAEFNEHQTEGSINTILIKYLDEYKGLFAIINNKPSIIKWFNKNRPNYIIGEILSGRTGLQKINFKELIAHYSIITDFKTVNLNRYSVRKIKALKMDNMVLGHVIDNKEKYQKYKDVCDNLFIDNLKELENEEF